MAHGYSRVILSPVILPALSQPDGSLCPFGGKKSLFSDIAMGELLALTRKALEARGTCFCGYLRRSQGAIACLSQSC